MRRLVVDDIACGIAEPPISDFLNRHASDVAKYLVREFVNDDARKGDDRHEPVWDEEHGYIITYQEVLRPGHARFC